MAVSAPTPSCVVYTPPALADAIVKALKAKKEETWLEPSCGGGVFLEALRRIGVAAGTITALDLDTTPTRADEIVAVKRGTDFLAWSIANAACRFDRIVGNPPYVRLVELPNALRMAALSVQQPNGRPVGLMANCWYAFLCAALKLLRPGGSLGVVLPAAWEYADYAAPLRAGVVRNFARVRVLRCSRPLFPRVEDGSVVLIATGWKGGPAQSLRSEHETLEDLVRNIDRACPVARLPGPVTLPGVRTTTLGRVATVRIGAVTGDADFFLLTESDRTEKGIPVSACVPVVSRSKHLATAVIGRAEWLRLRRSGRRIWLFRPGKAQQKIESVRTLLSTYRRAKGQSLPYKLRTRSPWYRTPLPETPDAFMSMHAGAGLWLALRGMKRLTATNTLYVVRFHERTSRGLMAAWGLALLTTRAVGSWESLVRHYPSGLRKLEPSDLGRVRLPVPPATARAITTYRKAVSLLLRGRVARSRAVADAWFNRHGKQMTLVGGARKAGQRASET